MLNLLNPLNLETEKIWKSQFTGRRIVFFLSLIFSKSYEQTKSGLFSITHTNYLVKTLPYGWDVKRRYSDFFWLRSTLQRLHPGVMVPPIPKKKNKNKAKPDFLRKRMYFLQVLTI